MISSIALLVAAAIQTTAADEAAQQTLLNMTASEMRVSLKNAQSARFMDVFFRSTIGMDKQKHWSICGKINSKNSYGAYTGFQSFLASPSRDGVYLRIDGGGEWIAGESCTRDRGTWLLDNDLSKRLTEIVTAL